MQKAVVVLDGLQFLNVVDCNKRGRLHWHFMVSQTLMNILKMKCSTTRYAPQVRLPKPDHYICQIKTCFLVVTANWHYICDYLFIFSLNKEARLQMKGISIKSIQWKNGKVKRKRKQAYGRIINLEHAQKFRKFAF